MLKGFVILVLLITAGSLGFSTYAQTVRGVVYDQQSRQALEGVSVVLQTASSERLSLSDEKGHFVFEAVPLGYVAVSLSRLGYEPEKLENVRVTGGREVLLELYMVPAVEELEQIVVQASRSKDRPVNQRANVSARSFTIEETTRFAGSYGDPARMAANYAGVLPARDNRNDIIVRGNSSSGLLWRIDGMEVPNPNHFGATGSTGGPITIINSNLLTRSDFFTGAYPAEYSNAIAGVFDLKMRKGNEQRREHWTQLGWNGLELGTEGPVSIGSGASYVMAYRYSFVDILSRMGLNLPETANYQDFSCKINVPTASAGVFSLTAIGGTSRIALLESARPVDEWIFPDRGEDIHNHYRMGALGVLHELPIGHGTRWNTSMYWSGSFVENVVDTFSLEDQKPTRWAHERAEQNKLSFSSAVRHRISTHTDFSLGAYVDQYYVSFSDSQFVHPGFIVMTDAEREALTLFRMYSDVQYRPSSSLTLYAGANWQYFTLSTEHALEPRLSVSWNLAPRHQLAYGLGLHHQVQPLMVYFVQQSEGVRTNQNLRFTRSLQQVLSYDWRIAGDLRLKAEVYYQELSRIPISTNDSVYSLANFGAEFYIEREDSLISKGEGRNYGVELTLEKFFNQGYYFLLTGSLFESQYKPLDGIWRSTAFNGRYAVNLLAGYEFHALQKGRSVNLGLNLTYAGGRPYVPYDTESSMAQQQVVYDWQNAYALHREAYRRVSFRIGFMRYRERYTTETAFDLQYRTNYTSVYLDRLNWKTGEVVSTQKMGFYPMATWRAHF